MDRKSEEVTTLRIQLEEQRAETLRLKTQLQEMDDRFFDSQAKTKEQLGRELRVSIKHRNPTLTYVLLPLVVIKLVFSHQQERIT